MTRAVTSRRVFLAVFVIAVLLIVCFLLNGEQAKHVSAAYFNHEDMHNNVNSGYDKYTGDSTVRGISAMSNRQLPMNDDNNFALSQRQETQKQELFDKQHSLVQEMQKHHQQRERELQQEIQQLQLQIHQLEVQLQQYPKAASNGMQPNHILPTVNSAQNNLPQTNNIVQEKPVFNALHPDVNIVPSYPSLSLVLPYKECVPLPNSPLSWIQICIHPPSEDKYISTYLKNNQLWEEPLVLGMQRAFEADSSLMLLDLGCNIGEYTLMAAAAGREVVAVEMLINNVELLQTSLQLSRLSSRVTIVNNAIYSDHRSLQVMFMSHNIGGTRLNTSRFDEQLDTNKGKVMVKTICLDDLLPLLSGKNMYMKMDIENSEHHALARAHKLFTEATVKIVQIEWMNISPDEEEQILQFMTTHGYAMSKSPLEHQPMSSLSKDLYFLKKSSFNII